MSEAVGTLSCQSCTTSVPDAEDDADHEERSDAVQCLRRRACAYSPTAQEKGEEGAEDGAGPEAAIC